MGAQKVVLIHDASREVSWSAVGWVLRDLHLKSGDEFTLLGILHQVNNPLGYKSKVDSSSLFGLNPRIVEEEISRKLEEYNQNAKMMQLSEKCQTEQIKFDIDVQAGHSPKKVALDAAKKLRVTWVVLDRQMKKDKKYFMEKLSCGISRMKRDNTIEQLRGPIEMVEKQFTKGKNKASSDQFSYGEMIPGQQNKKVSPKKSPTNHKTTLGDGQGGYIGGVPGSPPDYDYQTSYSSSYSDQMSTSGSLASSSSLWKTETSSCSEGKGCVTIHFPEEEEEDEGKMIDNEQETEAREKSLSPVQESREEVHTEASDKGSPYADEEFENYVCSDCKNRRPAIGREKDFTYAQLAKATNGFCKENFLSEGGFGSVYKGILENGLTVAVKQHKDVSFQGEKEFKSEVSVLNKARHPNLVRLLGSCSEGSHRLLVYEYVCNGSLDQHLSTQASIPLDWNKRIKIALDAAKGLEYLHGNNIIHRDMRPNNILVTHDYDSMLGDFGLARTQYDGSDHSTETAVVGTLGYVAPEYAEYGKVSTKTDVYSFGVVLLQLITGYKTIEEIFQGKSIVGWARPLLKEKNYPLLIDRRIEEEHDVHQLFWMVIVAEECLHTDPTKRITMKKVVEKLQFVIQGNTASISPTVSSSVNSVAVTPDLEDDAPENYTPEEDTNYAQEVASTMGSASLISVHEHKPEITYYEENVPSTSRCGTMLVDGTSLNRLMNDDDKLAVQSPVTEGRSSWKSARDARKPRERKRRVPQSGSDMLYDQMIN